MNIALVKLDDSLRDEFYLASIKRSGDIFSVVSKRITKDGRMVASCQDQDNFKFNTEKGAREKIRDLIKTKIKRQGWKPVDLQKLPTPVIKFLEVPPEMQVTPEELIMILRDAEKELYVTFSDVVGLEEYFDIGVQYIGYQTGDDHTHKIFDRFGTLRECFIGRFASVELTERAIEAKAIISRGGRPQWK